MKTALIHDWLISPVGGSENVLKEIYSLFPSPIYTLLYNPSVFIFAEVHTSFIQRLPKANFRSYLPLFPTAIERFDLSQYDLIISSSHCVAKGIKKKPHQLHICYCHTPMRYAWDLTEAYLPKSNPKRFLAKLCLRYLRNWDRKSSPRVDYFIANSNYVAERIQRSYGREATVIYPPVDTSYFSLEEKKENYFVTSSRLVPYKKIDLIVDAFAQMPDLKLVIIGDGPEAKKIEAKATKNIEFLGFQPNSVLRTHLQKAKAFVFAALEDFGILPIEAMACGTPVIALGKGGTAETVIDQTTGIHFEEQTIPSIIQAIRKFESIQFDPKVIAAHAQKFSTERFHREFKAFVTSKKSP